MKRKYPVKMFWLFVATNFVFHFFYLFVPGIILCVVGIWKRPCLWIGLAVLLLDWILSIIDQMKIRKAAITPSENQEFNKLMDAFCGPGGMEEFWDIVNKKEDASPEGNVINASGNKANDA